LQFMSNKGIEKWLFGSIKSLEWEELNQGKNYLQTYTSKNNPQEIYDAIVYKTISWAEMAYNLAILMQACGWEYAQYGEQLYADITKKWWRLPDTTQRVNNFRPSK
jgi:hypothetical protein